ncbi:hypothetical protein C0992_008627 [Termitomyces sp. T32_za158]|nr:hypothetical protein C0992_008627 [Termitomyces sp. T32_za158]
MPPTAPCAKPFPKLCLYIAITAVPPHASPPDPFANLKRSVKRDKNQVITAVLQHPLFASAVISICRTVRAFPGSGGDHAWFLGATHLRFADQADFDQLVDQKGLVEALLTTLPTLD